jgi:hypothetical protein
MLGALRGFDPGVFRETDDCSQGLCSFILALALAFNDCRDLLMCAEEILRVKPERPRRNRFCGEHGGLMTHVFRLLAAFVHELGELVRAHGRVTQESFFKLKVLPKLSKEHRAAWEAMCNLAHGKRETRSLDDLLEFFRNKVGYHYDAAALQEGYDDRFPCVPAVAQWPLVSLGARTFNERLYFADAAALRMIETNATERELMPLGPKMTDALTDAAIALAKIVEAFIQARKP